MSEEYISFLSKCKTERECVKEIVKIAESKGYRPINKVIREGKQLRPGDKVYGIHMNKAIVLFHIGHDSLENGMQIYWYY